VRRITLWTVPCPPWMTTWIPSGSGLPPPDADYADTVEAHVDDLMSGRVPRPVDYTCLPGNIHAFEYAI